VTGATGVTEVTAATGAIGATGVTGMAGMAGAAVGVVAAAAAVAAGVSGVTSAAGIVGAAGAAATFAVTAATTAAAFQNNDPANWTVSEAEYYLIQSHLQTTLPHLSGIQLPGILYDPEQGPHKMCAGIDGSTFLFSTALQAPTTLLPLSPTLHPLSHFL
jgi:hypothetical protein